jgi:hypothetical protein
MSMLIILQRRDSMKKQPNVKHAEKSEKNLTYIFLFE